MSSGICLIWYWFYKNSVLTVRIVWFGALWVTMSVLEPDSRPHLPFCTFTTLIWIKTFKLEHMHIYPFNCLFVQNYLRFTTFLPFYSRYDVYVLRIKHFSPWPIYAYLLKTQIPCVKVVCKNNHLGQTCIIT